MKLVAYRKEENENYRTGVLTDSESIADVEELSKQFGEKTLPANPVDFYTHALEYIEELQKILQEATGYESLSLHDVHLGMPLGKAKKVICVGKNYQEHVHEMKSDIPDFPVLFAKFDNAIIGPEDEIYYPSITEKLDYEVELTVVIGKTASKVKKEDAFDYIAGYTLANDTSARDLQKRTPQWLQGKSLDHTTPVGPWVVTKEEMDNSHAVNIRSYVNGEVRQSSNTEHLIFDIPFLVNFISEIMTLEPGDIILTGTPHGVGLAMEPSGLLQAGDRVKLEVEGIGTMENQVKKV
ncbi:fumarylacetoacetate hydrolase family protein [Oceanobacillus jeddahense]|uniref:Fumarylacetoacetate hydrolase family protein n=1 Tax=Oceanobacillus jeddahense TaxID=1462527 RepID=A0ABY5JSA3_9BACI|nr:fumarylacetoacetate hydrolase family protein [Oceanobacillus jeddahense]UUI02063.1 fumarylacetoacetate hydrolase family protein [Oceanobacillus jeddahense]